MEFTFEGWNETDVREEVIAPLLRKLGYRSGTRDDIIREQVLRYSKLSLGRKNPQKDFELRGKADYILEARKQVRWVIEAKAPTVSLQDDVVEQAWSYAAHPEIRAVSFVLCNGTNLIVYRTDRAPDAKPLLSMTYEQLDADFQSLENVLGPDALMRDFPDIPPDLGPPIAPGLRSISRITNGIVRFDRNQNPALGPLHELQWGIRQGAFQRDEAGLIVLFIESVAPIQSIQEANERLGFSKFEMITHDHQLSTDPNRPTIFTYERPLIIPGGEKFLDFRTWGYVELPHNITLDMSATASGTYDEHVFSGVFAVRYLVQGTSLRLAGSFEMYLG